MTQTQTAAIEPPTIEDYFKSMGLTLPALPGTLRDQLEPMFPIVYGSRTALSAYPYDLAAFVEEVEQGDAEDYVLIGQNGRGQNSQAMHCYIVHGNLALLVQIGFGGIYMDPDRTRTAVNDAMERISEIVALAEQGALPKQRLLIVEDDAGQSRWKILKDGAEWNLADNALEAVIKKMKRRVS